MNKWFKYDGRDMSFDEMLEFLKEHDVNVYYLTKFKINGFSEVKELSEDEKCICLSTTWSMLRPPVSPIITSPIENMVNLVKMVNRYFTMDKKEGFGCDMVDLSIEIEELSGEILKEMENEIR